MTNSKDEKPSAENIAYFAMAHSTGERVQSYVERGRQLKDLSEDDLRRMHVSTSKRFASDIYNEETRTAHNDCEAEHHIRGMKVDFSGLEHEFEAVIKQIEEGSCTLDREKVDQINERMTEEYEDAKRRKN